MDETAPVPSISSGSVGSRFISQVDVDKAKETRESQWKEAYARLGQEPPPVPQEDVYDGRSLFEKLQTQKVAKEEAWQEQHKLSKQFRALEEDEARFLDQINQTKLLEERKRKQEEGEELKGFRQAVAARSALPPPLIPGTTSAPKPPTQPPPRKDPPKPKVGLGKKDQKSLLKGVVVRKKEKPPTKPAKQSVDASKKEEQQLKSARVTGGDDEEEELPGPKRRKLA